MFCSLHSRLNCLSCGVSQVLKLSLKSVAGVLGFFNDVFSHLFGSENALLLSVINVFHHLTKSGVDLLLNALVGVGAVAFLVSKVLSQHSWSWGLELKGSSTAGNSGGDNLVLHVVSVSSGCR